MVVLIGPVLHVIYNENEQNVHFWATRRIANANEAIKIRSLVSLASKNFMLAMTSRRAALSGKTSLIVTFSSFIFN